MSKRGALAEGLSSSVSIGSEFSDQHKSPILKPPLKWAGGKRWQVPHLRRLWDPQKYQRLVEPFCGGLAITMGLLPTRAILNDINPHLINFYLWLKRGLMAAIPMINDERLYYEHRARFNELLATGMSGSRDAAALFYYFNRTGYNGLCRFNQTGQFNVPFGRYKRIQYVTDFTAYRQKFAEWHFTSDDFETLSLEREDFVYADPPYDVQFTQYAQQKFGWQEQVRTAEWLAKHRGPVVLSNQATERIVTLYERLGFCLKQLKAPRMISCTGDRTPASEVLAVKNL
jgi:DNA adenine methylase